jgi:ribosome-binding protein aMBF1 (putative translation factor)
MTVQQAQSAAHAASAVVDQLRVDMRLDLAKLRADYEQRISAARERSKTAWAELTTLQRDQRGK